MKNPKAATPPTARATVLCVCGFPPDPNQHQTQQNFNLYIKFLLNNLTTTTICPNLIKKPTYHPYPRFIPKTHSQITLCHLVQYFNLIRQITTDISTSQTHIIISDQIIYIITFFPPLKNQ